MIELPEAVSLSKQLNRTIAGKTITKVIAAQNPHKFAWYNGEPGEYPKRLVNKKIGMANAIAHFIEIPVEDASLLFSEGINLRFIEDMDSVPKKHQLLLEFSDKTALCASVQMYGGLWCKTKGGYDNDYFDAALNKPNPLTKQFNQKYFNTLIQDEKMQKLSVKGFLATEQRIPGLGNGVLQDILFNANLHPKKKVNSLNPEHFKTLFTSIKNTLKEMTSTGGRDTEKDLFNQNGGYITKLSKNTLGKPCGKCGSPIQKANYMGGSIYICETCQALF